MPPPSVADFVPIRLLPGDDLRRSIEQAVADRGVSAAFVVAGIGSLKPCQIRLAGAGQAIRIDGDVELLSLSGSIASNGSHLHLSVADAAGRVTAGHAAYGCLVRTTAELLLALLPGQVFTREPDARTGWDELNIRPRA